jgi:hypothetical protein
MAELRTLLLNSGSFWTILLFILQVTLPFLPGRQHARPGQYSTFERRIGGPIPIAAMLTALAGMRRGERPTYLVAMEGGLLHWRRLFTARFAAGLLVILGLVTFIVPGAILAVRYFLVDCAVVLEGRRRFGFMGPQRGTQCRPALANPRHRRPVLRCARGAANRAACRPGLHAVGQQLLRQCRHRLRCRCRAGSSLDHCVSLLLESARGGARAGRQCCGNA